MFSSSCPIFQHDRRNMVPWGHWFNPSDEQLVQTLEEIVRGKLTPDQLSSERFIEYAQDIDTYGFDPRKLNWDPREGMDENVRHCCIRRQKFSEKAKKKTSRKSGSTGNLSWKNTGNCNQEVCGGKAQKLKLTLAGDEITWIMLEYTLKAESDDFQEWAICRIERKIKNNNDKGKGRGSRMSKKRNEKEAGTSKDGTQESGSGFNYKHGQHCDHDLMQVFDDDPMMSNYDDSFYDALQNILHDGD